MTSSYLNKSPRSEAAALAARDPQACMDEIIKCLDRAAAFAEAIADEMPDLATCKQFEHLKQMLNDPEDGLWCDWIKPSREMLTDALEGAD